MIKLQAWLERLEDSHGGLGNIAHMGGGSKGGKYGGGILLPIFLKTMSTDSFQ